MATAKQPLTDYFKMLSSVLNLDPDEYHDGKGGGQPSPNTAFTSNVPQSAQTANNASYGVPTAANTAQLPHLADGGVIPPGGSAVVGDTPTSDADDTAPEVATNTPGGTVVQPVAPDSSGATVPVVPTGNVPTGPQGAVPTLTGAPPPGADLAMAQVMSPQTALPSPQSRLQMAQNFASYGNPNIINQTVQDLQSEDMNRQTMASNTIQMARNLNSLAQEGFATQKLAIEAANNATMAQAANDSNSALSVFTRAQVADDLTNKTVTDAQGNTHPIVGPAVLAQAQAFLAKNPTAYQIMTNPVLSSLPSVMAMTQTNIENAVKLQTAAAATQQAQAAQTNAGTSRMAELSLEQGGGTPGQAPTAGAPGAVVKPPMIRTGKDSLGPNPLNGDVSEARTKAIAAMEAAQRQLKDVDTAAQAVQGVYSGLGGDAAANLSAKGQAAQSDLARVGIDRLVSFGQQMGGVSAMRSGMVDMKDLNTAPTLGKWKDAATNALQVIRSGAQDDLNNNEAILNYIDKNGSLAGFRPSLPTTGVAPVGGAPNAPATPTAIPNGWSVQ